MRWIATLLFTASFTGPASATSPLLGEWIHIIVEEPASSRQACRYFDVTTRTYSLSQGPNNGVQGAYFLQTERRWPLQPMDACAEGERQPADPLKFYRNDMWLVTGEMLNGTAAKLQGRYAKCVGACANPRPLADRFETEITLKGGLLEDKNLRSTFSNFRSADVVRRDSQAAADAIYPLLRPLLAGKCNEFYVSSVDPDQQFATRQDDFCEVANKISKFLPPVMYEEPGFAFSTSMGSLHLPTLLLFGDGDVLVERILTLSGDKGKMGILAILRKQKDGSWRVWRLSP
jgi:hypothetical protein